MSFFLTKERASTLENPGASPIHEFSPKGISFTPVVVCLPLLSFLLTSLFLLLFLH